jgi:methylglyoxal synthase
MDYKTIVMEEKKRIVLIAHYNKKTDLLEWAKFNRETLAQHDLYATGTTGSLIEDDLGLPITKLQSGPLGGDQQVGAMISNGEVDVAIFFIDALSAHSHDVDIKALLRLATVWNIPIACTRASADFIISSHLMGENYERIIPDYEGYQNRFKKTTKPKRKPSKEKPQPETT